MQWSFTTAYKRREKSFDILEKKGYERLKDRKWVVLTFRNWSLLGGFWVKIDYDQQKLTAIRLKGSKNTERPENLKLAGLKLWSLFAINYCRRSPSLSITIEKTASELTIILKFCETKNPSAFKRKLYILLLYSDIFSFEMVEC